MPFTTITRLGILVASSVFQDAPPQQRGVQLVTESTPTSAGYANRHALVIGVNNYEDPAFPDLGHAVADAEAVAKTLVERFGFSEENVQLILDEHATKERIEVALEEWSTDPDRIGEEDFFVLFFAGHGITREVGGRGQSGYLVPVNGEQRRGKPSWGSLVGMNDLEDISEYIPAKHALFILDCCFGGLAVKRQSFPMPAGLSNRARQVITAGNAEQPVLDTGGGGHSVFTAAVLDALEGSADLDADQAVTFGELFIHVGRMVEQKTENRQTPLQATFPDHEGGSIAFFAPGFEPRRMTAQDRLQAMERTAEQRLEELERFSDARLARKLEEIAGTLWPRHPEKVAEMQVWLSRASELLVRLPLHRESLLHVRQETYLKQVLGGLIEEGEGEEPLWDQADQPLAWRFDTLTELVDDLERLQRTITDVADRKRFASTIWQRSIGDHQEEWEDAINEIALSEVYDGLEISPQIGLVPLGPDPDTGLWEFWHMGTGMRPQRAMESSPWSIQEDTGLVLVLLPGGSFPMGAAPPEALNGNVLNKDPAALKDEGPVHRVQLDPLFISKYEMTQGQWLLVDGKNPSQYGPSYPDVKISLSHPVECVSWDDAVRILSRVGLQLPTEARWEYAARGGTDTPWFCGSSLDAAARHGNFADDSARKAGDENWAFEVPGFDDGIILHAPVGSFPANPFGLHDTMGNVFEWCQDWYGDYAKFAARPGDGLRLVVQDAVSPGKVCRGGSFALSLSQMRSSKRESSVPGIIDFNYGVRPVRSLDP